MKLSIGVMGSSGGDLADEVKLRAFRLGQAVCKLYAESFKGRDHLGRTQEEAHAIIQNAFTAEARD
jgi:phosphoglucomutase